MKILAIETATEACSAALLITDEVNQSQKMAARFQHAPREHTKLILPMLEEVLEEAKVDLKEVDAIAFGRGPGAFTGLRIAAGIAQGVALSIDKPVVPVSTLAALAMQAVDDQHNASTFESVVVALDARMDEVYWGEFIIKNNSVERVGEEQVSNAHIMLSHFNNKKILAIGNGWQAYFNEFPKNVCFVPDAFPSAQQIAQLALPLYLENQAVSVEEAQPVYIRNNVAKKSQKITSK